MIKGQFLDSAKTPIQVILAGFYVHTIQLKVFALES